MDWRGWAAVIGGGALATVIIVKRLRLAAKRDLVDRAIDRARLKDTFDPRELL